MGRYSLPVGSVAVFEIDMVTPANTPEASPLSQKLDLPSGIIKEIHIQHPPGSINLLHTKLLLGGHDFIPVNQGSSIKGEFVPPLILPSGRYVPEYDKSLEIRTWNEDDTYSHTATIRILVVVGV